MKPIVAVDIGAGTTDVLVWNPDNGESYKAVAMSPIRRLSRIITAGQGPLLITGSLMGGGYLAQAVTERSKRDTIYMTPDAGRTIKDDLDQVMQKGICIVSEAEAVEIRHRESIDHVEFGDVSPSGLRNLLAELGVAWDFALVAGAVQDHGVAPESVNSLDFRHEVMKGRLDADPRPESCLFSDGEIPAYLTRMKATAALLRQLPAEKVFMMDTGIAAIMGASLDPRVQHCKSMIVADIGNSHTLAAVVQEGVIGGLFEYHTGSITGRRMDELLVKLGNGDLNHRGVVAEGGHGAYIREVPGFEQIEEIVVTGPRRAEILKDMSLSVLEGAPLGDTMMTGTAGLLESVMRAERLHVG
ncbi:MAG TPA: DUF1786 family protein [Thermodesulfobacteriota bacterium]|nr:rod shape-determining protein [Deltaproteobacteria bacterium]HNR11862.1 DUF1786 family protein [Thermodesulfobacteriota bacterium]HNU70745.1 DUF1786 family protein [Thermodesulfobacteriota bacterium]HOC39753.1 DUF1786 family protein [Thermodesulfobacteriota bacterium]